ncbi:MAG: lipopolysaccharide core heptose(I) kinase RfaP [Pseudomonadota bacterium]|nr:lipopolysaccharide core heptose(I) kinase RfaP [Pseudomonadota bacterium]
MKFAFCLFKYFEYGGLQRDFLRIATECTSRGHDVHAFVSEWRGAQPSGITVTVLKTWGWIFNHAQNKHFHHQLQHELHRTRFDCVVGFDRMPNLDIYYGADFCYIGRAVPRYGPWYRIGPRYRHFHTFEKAVFGRDSKTLILSLSEREKSVYQQHYFTEEDRFHQLPPTLDSNRMPVPNRAMEREAMRAQLSAMPDDHLLLFIGSGFKVKGLDRAITALANLPERLRSKTRLAIVGEGESRARYAKDANKRGVLNQISFLGGRGDIPQLLSAGDLLVHPANDENTGTVLLEAITAGLPVLATDVCGYAEHIKQADAGRVLASPFEQSLLDQTLEQMLTSPEREKWAQNGLAYGKPELYRMPETAVDLIEAHCRTLRQDYPVAKPTPQQMDEYYRDDLKAALGDKAVFSSMMRTQGEAYREPEGTGRRTVRFDLANRHYFIKTHTGVGWQEILKNLIYFRLPVLGAMDEWHGIHHLQRLKIKTLSVAAYGTTGGMYNWARRRSFIVTDEISGSKSLEEFCREWKTHPPGSPSEIRFKRWLIEQVAVIARKMHNSGANHRDFYLGHFMLQPGYRSGQLSTDASRLFVIDLHRMQLRRRTPTRWQVKDIAGLRFSSFMLGLTKTDQYRFIRTYWSENKSLGQSLGRGADFWRDPQQSLRNRLFWWRVESWARKLQQAEERRGPDPHIGRAVQTTKPHAPH